MPIFLPTAANLDRCAALLREGGLVGLPTETVYGLGANACNPDAVKKIFSVKGRPLLDPLIVHVATLKQADELGELSPVAKRLADHYWPGPLTLVVPKKSCVSDLITAGLPSVAIRIPGQTDFLGVLKRVDFPIAAPSANPFGYVSPTTAKHVEAQLGSQIDAILDAGPTTHGLESTILDLRNADSIHILRPGPITAEHLTAAGFTIDEKTTQENGNDSCVAPGLLSQHYSPHTPLTLFSRLDALPDQIDSETAAIVFLAKPDLSKCLSDHQYWLSENGDLSTIAQNLFALIRKLDVLELNHIYIQTPECIGLGKAINDRLQRAAAKR